jgi:hypothetical protein
MSVPALTQVDPAQFFRLPSTNGAGTQRLDTQVSGVAVSKDLSGLLTVTTAEGDRITLTADLESDFRSVNYRSQVNADGTKVDLQAKYAEYSLKQEFGVTVDGNLNEEEVKDLEKLFRKVSNIFKKFFNGQDEEALAKTARLAERFGNLSSLSGLDLQVGVERSVTAFAAQIASEVTGQSSVPTGRQPQTSAIPSHTTTSGGAPATGAVIPQPSTGTTAPTQSSTAASVAVSAGDTRLSATAQESPQSSAFLQQLLDTLKEAKIDSHKVRRHLPDFLTKLREDFEKELRDGREQTPAINQAPTTASATSATVLFAYQSVRHTSLSLSIHS